MQMEITPESSYTNIAAKCGFCTGKQLRRRCLPVAQACTEEHAALKHALNHPSIQHPSETVTHTFPTSLTMTPTTTPPHSGCSPLPFVTSQTWPIVLQAALVLSLPCFHHVARNILIVGAEYEIQFPARTPSLLRRAAKRCALGGLRCSTILYEGALEGEGWGWDGAFAQET